MELAGYDYAEWKDIFYKDEAGFIKQLEQLEDKEQFLLWFYVRLAEELYSDFQQDGIDDQIYYDTFYDITIWYKRCKLKKGITGIGMEVADWIALSLKRKLYRLGRLQFEPGITEIAGKDEKVLHVHIPEGEKLDIEKCKASFRQAEKFFGEEYPYFDCESWLLSPNLQAVLNDDSNIIRFQKLFQIEKTVYTFCQAQERVYGYIADDIDSYPEGTNLQKSLKIYLKEHGDPGIGYGIIKKDGSYIY